MISIRKLYKFQQILGCIEWQGNFNKRQPYIAAIKLKEVKID